MSKATEHYQEFISRLHRVVADYEEGLVRIDREFDDACRRIDLSLGNIGGEADNLVAHSKRKQSQETRLHQQAEAIERDIANIDGEIAKIDQGVAAVDSSLRILMDQKASLEQQIQNRWLIERIFYLFVHDKDTEECEKLQRDLDGQVNKKSILETTKRKLEFKRSGKLIHKNRLQDKLKHIRRRLAALKTNAEHADAQAGLLADKHAEAERRRQLRKSNLLKALSANWDQAVKEIAHEVLHIRRQQPALSRLDKHDSGMPAEMPCVIFLGEQEISFNAFRCRIPHGIRFPFEHALILPGDNHDQRRLAHLLLLRLLQAIPAGWLEITLIDPIKLGQSFEPFLPLLNVKALMPQQRVLTRSDEIEQVLGRLMDETEHLIQQRFKGRISNWSDFNVANVDSPLPYRIVLVFNIPAQLSDKSLWYLERLTENGPRCGILPIIAVDCQGVDDRRYGRLCDALYNSTQRLDALLRIDEENHTGGLSYTYLPEEWPRQEALEKFFSELAERYAAKGRFSKTMPDLWAGYKRGSTTIDGFDIPIGWTPSGDIVSLKLGATNSEHHALLAGKTGSGKSNLLHVIIHSLAEKYGPHEVNLYLLDYKESTEFAVYASPLLPQAHLVATESDPEYGVTVLRHLVDELERRAKLFKSEGVRDFAEYRKAHQEPMPRALLIIDEFQVLFTEGRQVAEQAENLLSQLLKQGRSFGIHIILSTQTLKGINALSLGALISQLGCRIALACSQEDSAMILAGNNWAAAELKSPPEGIINNANGAKSGNVKFLIPLSKRNFCLTHLQQLAKRAGRRNIKCKGRVFDGANLPLRPASKEFRDICGQFDVLLLGEQLTFACEPLKVPLTKRQAFNVLFCGYNDEIHDGLLVSSLASMSCVDSFDDVIYFNGRGIEPDKGFSEASLALGKRFKAFCDIGHLPLQEIANNIGKRRTALIIDGLDTEKALHPTPTFKASRPGSPAPPADLLKSIAEEGPRNGTFVFLFIDNWRRCAVPCKDLFNLFELRVAFCMNEDDAGALVSGGIGKFKGIEKPNRAVFVNRMTNAVCWFRPYIAGENP